MDVKSSRPAHVKCLFIYLDTDMAITTPTTLPAPVQQTFDDVLLSVRTPNLIMKLGALTKRLPSKGGRTLRMARYDRLPTAPVPLGPSGATPPATPLNRVDIDATMSFYGLYVAINQQVTLQNQDPICNKIQNGVVKSFLIDLEAEVAFC
jgi:N4-gp56 family major capsid protein